MTNAQFIQSLPLSARIRAYNALNNKPVVGANANDIFQWLLSGLDAHAFTRSDMEAAGAKTPAPAQINDAVQAVASRAEQSALDALARADKAISESKNAAQGAASLAFEVQQLRKASQALGEKINGVDPQAVHAQVGRLIADAFAPFEAAVRGAGAESIVAALAPLSSTRQSALDVFGIEVNDTKGNPLMFDVYTHPDAPAIDPMFIWTESIIKALAFCQDTSSNAWFAGDRGTGKSMTAQEFCARTGRAFKRINFNKFSTCEDFIGAVGLENGATVFKYGDFLQAFTSPATVILLDEVTNADPGVLAVLNGLLESKSAVSYGGITHRRAPGVLAFVADNTLGNGDDSGRYAGTRMMNSALIDRFSLIIRFDYLPLAQEVQAVVNHTGCTADLAEHVLKAIHAARAKVETADIVDAPSIRSVVAYIRALKYLSPGEAWAQSIAARQPAESAHALEAIRLTYIDEQFIANNL
jgi:MoxR-like ATPase